MVKFINTVLNGFDCCIPKKIIWLHKVLLHAPIFCQTCIPAFNIKCATRECGKGDRE